MGKRLAIQEMPEHVTKYPLVIYRRETLREQS